jgi:hypothetical protein
LFNTSPWWEQLAKVFFVTLLAGFLRVRTKFVQIDGILSDLRKGA